MNYIHNVTLLGRHKCPPLSAGIKNNANLEEGMNKHPEERSKVYPRSRGKLQSGQPGLAYYYLKGVK